LRTPWAYILLEQLHALAEIDQHAGKSESLMTKERIQLLQQHFLKMLSVSDLTGQLFYRRLFELDPSLRSMFKADMQEMTRQLMQTVGMIVTGLSTPHEVMNLVAEHGRKHGGLVLPRHIRLAAERFTGSTGGNWTTFLITRTGSRGL